MDTYKVFETLNTYIYIDDTKDLLKGTLENWGRFDISLFPPSLHYKLYLIDGDEVSRIIAGSDDDNSNVFDVYIPKGYFDDFARNVCLQIIQQDVLLRRNV